jgi:hypothetical protein
LSTLPFGAPASATGGAVPEPPFLQAPEAFMRVHGVSVQLISQHLHLAESTARC